MRLAIIGSRKCKKYDADVVVRHIPTDTSLIISGGAAGIDTLAEIAAAACGIPFRKILPEYQKYGKNAPLIRNLEIIKNADQVLAFWDFSSRGTASVIAACIERQIPVEVIGLD